VIRSGFRIEVSGSGVWRKLSPFLFLLACCGTEETNANDKPDAMASDVAASPHDAASSSETTAERVPMPVVADAATDDSNSCTYPNYTWAEIQADMDEGGTYPNLPCGGCGPSTDVCSGGVAYDCWTAQGYPSPPAPTLANLNCMPTGARVGLGPIVYHYCCR
jgi:hypothetical protein